MNESGDNVSAERPDSFWNRVYIAVVATAVIVIALLYGFTKYFS